MKLPASPSLNSNASSYLCSPSTDASGLPAPISADAGETSPEFASFDELVSDLSPQETGVKSVPENVLSNSRIPLNASLKALPSLRSLAELKNVPVQVEDVVVAEEGTETSKEESDVQPDLGPSRSSRRLPPSSLRRRTAAEEIVTSPLVTHAMAPLQWMAPAAPLGLPEDMTANVDAPTEQVSVESEALEFEPTEFGNVKANAEKSFVPAQSPLSGETPGNYLPSSARPRFERIWGIETTPTALATPMPGAAVEKTDVTSATPTPTVSTAMLTTAPKSAAAMNPAISPANTSATPPLASTEMTSASTLPALPALPPSETSAVEPKPRNDASVESELSSSLTDALVAADSTPGGVGIADRRTSFAGPARTAAKFAPVAQSLREPEISPLEISSLKSLNSVEQQVNESIKVVGTGIAKRSFEMPASSPHTLSAPAAPFTAPLMVLSTDSGVAEAVQTLTADVPVENINTAGQAVEAALTAADKFAAGKSSVDLRFSVGGEDLVVRVELRANEVHATFRTESADLRAALSNEWQAVNATTQVSHDRPFRLATPVFESSVSADAGASSGQGGAQQQQPRQAETPAGTFAGHAFASARAVSERSPERTPDKTAGAAVIKRSATGQATRLSARA